MANSIASTNFLVFGMPTCLCLWSMIATDSFFQEMDGSLAWFKKPFRKAEIATLSLRSASRIGKPS